MNEADYITGLHEVSWGSDKVSAREISWPNDKIKPYNFQAERSFSPV